MLYLNYSFIALNTKLLNLTLTSVVFELDHVHEFDQFNLYLTLTSVVFEYIALWEKHNITHLI